jgi:soluble lytic murein transglycosylase-like protein
VLLFLFFFNVSVRAGTVQEAFYHASVKYKISYRLLWAVAKVESEFKPVAIHINNNGSYDVGLMQINSCWFTELARKGFSVNKLITPKHNVEAGALIIRYYLNKGYGIWQAVGMYHSGNTRFSITYVRKVERAYYEIGYYLE